ncbi:hypothetical protein VP01_1022g6 [Puccinia sorghi]|uniref:Uncharacterized protein n=1 Tax=Puccinia sorghi TaxID=27349 RepID=A0A0L6VW48_9BASI|nr:hypothetical protein VP01_1022g6 [Puccinia sorghi]
MMDGYEDRDWDKLKASMKEAWSDLFPKMKYLKAYNNYAANFMVIEKYLFTNEHISSDKDVIYIFLSASPCETRIKIKRELISNDKIKFSADGYCKPPALSDLLEFTEREIKAASNEAFGYGRAFFESNRKIQSTNSKRSSNSTKERPRGNEPTSRTLYESRTMICFYCRRISSNNKGLGKIPYDASRTIRTIVATKSSKSPPKKVISKVAFVENYQTDEEESKERIRDNSSRMDVDQQYNLAEKVQESDKRKMKVIVKADKIPETILGNELENIKIQTKFSQLTASSPVYSEEIVKRLSKKLADPSKFNVSYISRPEEIQKYKSSMLSR